MCNCSGFSFCPLSCQKKILWQRAKIPHGYHYTTYLFNLTHTCGIKVGSEIGSVEAGLMCLLSEQKAYKAMFRDNSGGKTCLNKNSFFKIKKLMYAFASDSLIKFMSTAREGILWH